MDGQGGCNAHKLNAGYLSSSPCYQCIWGHRHPLSGRHREEKEVPGEVLGLDVLGHLDERPPPPHSKGCGVFQLEEQKGALPQSSPAEEP